MTLDLSSTSAIDYFHKSVTQSRQHGFTTGLGYAALYFCISRRVDVARDLLDFYAVDRHMLANALDFEKHEDEELFRFLDEQKVWDPKTEHACPLVRETLANPDDSTLKNVAKKLDFLIMETLRQDRANMDLYTIDYIAELPVLKNLKSDFMARLVQAYCLDTLPGLQKEAPGSQKEGPSDE